MFLLCRRRFEPVGFPLSVHLYFYDDRFQGYLVRQEVLAVGSKVKETLEMWAVPQVTFILEPNLKEFERLKNLEVSVFGSEKDDNGPSSILYVLPYVVFPLKVPWGNVPLSDRNNSGLPN